MYHAIHNSSRYLLATLAFTIVFMLTPRAWVDGADSPTTSRQVPVDTLEQPGDTCLWCNSERAVAPEQCDDSDDDSVWLNPDDPQPSVGSDDCDDSDVDQSGPNA